MFTVYRGGECLFVCKTNGRVEETQWKNLSYVQISHIAYSTQRSQMVPNLSTDLAGHNLTSIIERELVFSLGFDHKPNL